MVAAVTSSPRVCFFIFHYESGLVLKIVFENVFLGRLFPHFFIFHFSFSSTSHRRNEKRTRAHQWWRLCQACHVFAFIFFLFGNAIYHIFFFCVCTRALHMCFHSYMCKALAHSSQFPPPPNHARAAQAHLVPLFCRSLTPSSISSFLSCIGWLHGSHLCLGQRSHRRRGAPPGGRRGQGREEQGKRLRD